MTSFKAKLAVPFVVLSFLAAVTLLAASFQPEERGTGDFGAEAPSSGAAGAEDAALSYPEHLSTAGGSLERTVLLVVALVLALVALLAYIQGRSVVRTVDGLVDAAGAIADGRLSERVPVRGTDELALLARSFNEMAGQFEARVEDLEAERRRSREVTLHFAEVLAATHDADQLLRAIVETAVEATRARGGVVVGRAGGLVEAGRPGATADRIELPLVAGSQDYGTLLLTGPAFTDEDRQTAALLVSHGIVALENARLHRVVQLQALVDGLTGLANRRQAENAIAAEFGRATRQETPLALVLADLDSFKAVNDRYGHPAGDVLLREFAEVLRDAVREIDLAARWGGEEFALVLPGTEAEGAAALAERIRAALSQRTILTPDAEEMRVTASFGVAVTPPAATPEQLLAAADAALYEAKRTGKDRVVVAAEAARR